MDSRQIRKECLELALRSRIGSTTHNSGDIIKESAAYADFVANGLDSSGSSSSTNITPMPTEGDSSSVPAKGRKTKAAVAEDGEKLDAALKEHDIPKAVSTPSATTEVVGAGQITYAKVKDAVLEVARAKGREASLELLTIFGVVSGEGDARKGKIDQLREEQFADVVAKAREMLVA